MYALYRHVCCRSIVEHKFLSTRGKVLGQADFVVDGRGGDLHEEQSCCWSAEREHWCSHKEF